MATSTISNTIKDPSGTALSGVPVTVRLMPGGGFRESDFTEVARVVTTTTNGSGVWSLVLERNSNITPENTWYEVVEDIPGTAGGKRVWLIQVGDSDQSVLASLVTPAEAFASDNYLTQTAADARYQALGGLSSSSPNTIEPDDAASAGVSTSASRADHEHGIVAAAPTGIGLAGTNSEGAATSFARSNHVHAYSPPAVRLTHSTTQSLTDNTEASVTFDTETYDTDTMHAGGAPTRITFTTAGIYVITWSLSVQADTDYTFLYTYLRKNGSGVHTMGSGIGTLTDNGWSPHLTGTATDKFAAADFVEIRANQNNTSGDARTILASGIHFAATWIGVG